MPPVDVRPARPDDLPVLVQFQLAMGWETESLRLNPLTVTQGVKAVLDDPSKGRYLVAQQHGKPVGCLLITYEWSDWRNGCVLWIQSVYVVPEARRQGVFRALYGHVRQLASQPPYVGIRLYVDRLNTTAQRVYEKLGMKGDHYQVWEWFP